MTEDRRAMPSETWKREAALAAALFCVGFVLLPAAIYWVGERLIGGYALDGGMMDLAEHIWSDFLRLNPAAWLLVLSPYLVVQLLRLAVRAIARRPV